MTIQTTKMPLVLNSTFNFRLSFHDIIILVGVILLALILRLPSIDSQGLWHDELYTYANIVGFDIYLFPGSDLSTHEPIRPASYYTHRLGEDLFLTNLWRNIVHEGHPPLYLLLTKAWTSATALSPNMLRLFSIITSIITIPLIYLIGNRVGGKSVAIFSALFFATSPFHTFFSIEARNYSLYILLATVATIYALSLYDNINQTKHGWIGWIVSATCACLTHYFSVFYCLLLIVFFILPSVFRSEAKNKVKLISLSFTPLIIFSMWLPVWYLQISAHSSGHWTDGWAGLANSLEYSIYGFLELLAGPLLQTPGPEHIYLALLLIISIFVILTHAKQSKSYLPLQLIAILPVHVAIVILIDKILDHHTISVARYSSSLTIPLTLILAFGMSRLHKVGIVLALIYSIFMIHTSILTSRGERAPRQMLAEVASYINSNSSKNDIVIVTPSGPTLIGLALYLKPDTKITAIPAHDLSEWIKNEKLSPDKTIWSVQQRLGLTYESWKDPSTPIPLSLTRFAGVDLAKY